MINKQNEILEPGTIEFEKKIQELKNKYGAIYQMEIADQLFLFKPISRKEYKEIINKNYDLDINTRELTMIRETEMAKKVIVYPEKKVSDAMIEQFAGIAEVITEECLRISGFLNMDERTVTKL